MMHLLLMLATAVSTNATDTQAASCYSSTETSTPYEILERAVGTRRDCESLCDTKETCSGFAYKSTALTPCVLLSSVIPNKMCAAKTTIFLKQTEGCGETTELSTASTTVQTTTQERRMIGIVKVVDPASLTLNIFNEKLDVSNDPQWNTATFIKIFVLSTGGCTITVTHEQGSVTESLSSFSNPKTATVSKIREVVGACTSSDFKDTLTN